MKLFYSNTSPYARKVRLLILEKGLGDKVMEHECNPFEDVPVLGSANPLHKVPTLITDDGVALYDSPVICEYLDSLEPENRLLPGHGMQRWAVRRWEALADGILDASYNIVMERRRPIRQQSPQWIVRWETDVARAITHINDRVGDLPATMTLAQLALGAALAYLDFRLPQMHWRDGNCAIAAWHEGFACRSSMVRTMPE